MVDKNGVVDVNNDKYNDGVYHVNNFVFNDEVNVIDQWLMLKLMMHFVIIKAIQSIIGMIHWQCSDDAKNCTAITRHSCSKVITLLWCLGYWRFKAKRNSTIRSNILSYGL